MKKIKYIFLITLLASCKATNKSIKTIVPFVSDSISINKEKKIILDEDNTSLYENYDYYTNDFLRYEDYIYKPNIHTVLLHRKGWELSAPIIQLNTDEKLTLSFDDLDGDIKNYKYTIIHCSYEWKPSPLSKNEYINGFKDNYITNFKLSFNTIQKYTHYELTFPESNIMTPLISGNYLLIVYLDDETNIYFSKRFMIIDPKITINATIKRATSIEYKDYKQEIDFTINKSGYNIPNIYSDLKVSILQNGRWDNAVKNIKPFIVKGDILDYNYDDINVFNGGNEFRYFDIKSIKYYSDRIKKITYEDGKNHVYLLPDLPRQFKTYESYKDINGRRLIKTEDANNNDIESDYAVVHFFLPYYEEFDNGNLYIFGALTNWQFTKEAIAKYNYQEKGYMASLFLKQGYYNYQYVFLEDGKNSGDETLIEGNHYETENEYTILVYHKEPGTVYDKLIGLKQINSSEF